MKSKLAQLLGRISAQAVKPDVDAMTNSVGDLRYAMGIDHLPDDKPVMYFLFHNADRGPEEHYWETRAENVTPSSALNRVSTRAITHPGARSRQNFDKQHYLEMQQEPSRPTLPANMAMAVSIENHRRFEQLALRVGRAFVADTQNIGDLTLTIAYLPPVEAKWPMQPPYQMTFSPTLSPAQAVPADKGTESELCGEQGRQAWNMVQAYLKTKTGLKQG